MNEWKLFLDKIRRGFKILLARKAAPSYPLEELEDLLWVENFLHPF